jgi:Tol biopolymer transport system component
MKAYPARRLAATASFVIAFSCMPLFASGSDADGHRHDCDVEGSILFSRSQMDVAGNLNEAGLFRADASGGHVVQLTPLKLGDLYIGGRWSPEGRDIVYEYTTYSANLVTPTQLYRANRDGGAVRQITVGPGPKLDPVWSPNGWIAFINGQDENGCLWIVRPDGRDQHLLFCPNLSVESVDAPQWSLDGKYIYLDVRWLPPIGLEPPEYSNLYKVNAETGEATLILSYATNDGLFDLSVSVAPDGNHGIYVENLSGTMQVIGYPAGNVVAQMSGYAPVWSKDSKHFVFTRNLSVPGTSRNFGALFVADADGSHERQLTPTLVANEFFEAADWLDDGTHVVVNRSYNKDTMLIIDVNTGATTKIAEGTAALGAWTKGH